MTSQDGRRCRTMASDYFHPSEIARLILGYLKQKGLKKTYACLLRECPDLQEYWKLLYSGSVPPTSIMGLSLTDILNEFCSMKLSAIRREQRNASRERAELASHLEERPCVAGPSGTSLSAVPPSFVSGFTATTVCASLPSSSPCQTLSAGGTIEPPSSSLPHGAVPLNAGHSLEGGQGTTDAGTLTSSAKSSCPSHGGMAELEDPLERLLEDTKLPEKLAESINRALKDTSFLDELDKAMQGDDAEVGRETEDPAVSEKHCNETVRPNIDSVVALTTSDPRFEELMTLMKHDAPSLIPASTAGSRTHDSQPAALDAHYNVGTSHRILTKTNDKNLPQTSVRQQDGVTSNCTYSTPVTTCDVAQHNQPPISSRSAGTSQTSNPTEPPLPADDSPAGHSQTGTPLSKMMPPPAAPEECSRRSRLKRLPRKSFRKSENFIHKVVKMKRPCERGMGAVQVSVSDGNAIPGGIESTHAPENNTRVSHKNLNVKSVHDNDSASTDDDFSKSVMCKSSTEHSCSEDESGIKGNISRDNAGASVNQGSNNQSESKSLESFCHSEEDIDPNVETSNLEQDVSTANCDPDRTSLPREPHTSSASDDRISLSTETVASHVQQDAPSEEVCATVASTVPLINENSLSVFSLIEKNIAEMHGEVFIPRHLRNQPTEAPKNIASVAETTATPVTATNSSASTQTNTTVVTSFRGVTTLTGQDSSNKSAEPVHNNDTHHAANATTVASEQGDASPEKPQNPETRVSSPVLETEPQQTDGWSDDDFDNRLSTPDAILVRPIGPYPSVLHRNFHLVDECLKSCLGKLTTVPGPLSSVTSSSSPSDLRNNDDVHSEGTENCHNHIMPNAQRLPDNVDPQEPLPNDSQPSGEEKAKDSPSTSVTVLSIESRAFNRQESSELDKKSAEECQLKKIQNDEVFNSSHTISVPFTSSGKVPSTDKRNRRFLPEGHHDSGQCVSMPALLPSMKRSADLPDSTRQSSARSPPSAFRPLTSSKFLKPAPFMSPPATLQSLDTRRVISVDCLHSPYIPDHCKKNPSRRVTPIEVSSWTPSPLQVPSPSSPANFVIDIPSSPALPGSPRFTPGHPIPQSPLAQPTSMESSSPVAAAFAGKSPATDASKVGPPSFSLTKGGDASDGEKSKSQASASSLVCRDGVGNKASGSKVGSVEIKMPLSPSRRKPRRVVPKLLVSYPCKHKAENSTSSPSGKSTAVDDAKTVSSSSDLSTPSEVEAIRILKSYLHTYTKPQPKEEITSSGQILKASPPPKSKCGCASRSNCKHRKGRGRRSPTSPGKAHSEHVKTPSKTVMTELGSEKQGLKADPFHGGDNETQTDKKSLVDDHAGRQHPNHHDVRPKKAGFTSSVEPLTNESVNGTTVRNLQSDFRTVGTVEYLPCPSRSFDEHSSHQSKSADAFDDKNIPPPCIQEHVVSTSPRKKDSRSISGLPPDHHHTSSKVDAQSFASTHLSLIGHSQQTVAHIEPKVINDNQNGEGEKDNEHQGHRLQNEQPDLGCSEILNLERSEALKIQPVDHEDLCGTSNKSSDNESVGANPLAPSQHLLTSDTERVVPFITGELEQSLHERGDGAPKGSLSPSNERIPPSSNAPAHQYHKEGGDISVEELSLRGPNKDCSEGKEDLSGRSEIEVSAPYFPELSNTLDFFNRLKGKCLDGQGSEEKTTDVAKVAAGGHAGDTGNQPSQQANNQVEMVSSVYDDFDLNSQSNTHFAPAEKTRPDNKVRPPSPGAMSMDVSLLRQAMVECDIPHLAQEGDTNLPSQDGALPEEMCPATLTESQVVPPIQAVTSATNTMNSSKASSATAARKPPAVQAKRQRNNGSNRPILTMAPPPPPKFPQITANVDVTYNSRYAPICPKVNSAPVYAQAANAPVYPPVVSAPIPAQAANVPVCPAPVSAPMPAQAASAPLYPTVVSAPIGLQTASAPISSKNEQVGYAVVYVPHGNEMVPFLIPPTGLPIMLPQAQDLASTSAPTSQNALQQSNSVPVSSEKVVYNSRDVKQTQSQRPESSHKKKKKPKGSKEATRQKESVVTEDYSPQQKIGVRRKDVKDSNPKKNRTSSYFKNGLRPRAISQEADAGSGRTSTPIAFTDVETAKSGKYSVCAQEGAEEECPGEVPETESDAVLNAMEEDGRVNGADCDHGISLDRANEDDQRSEIAQLDVSVTESDGTETIKKSEAIRIGDKSDLELGSGNTACQQKELLKELHRSSKSAERSENKSKEGLDASSSGKTKVGVEGKEASPAAKKMSPAAKKTSPAAKKTGPAAKKNSPAAKTVKEKSKRVSESVENTRNKPDDSMNTESSNRAQITTIHSVHREICLDASNSGTRKSKKEEDSTLKERDTVIKKSNESSSRDKRDSSEKKGLGSPSNRIVKSKINSAKRNELSNPESNPSLSVPPKSEDNGQSIFSSSSGCKRQNDGKDQAKTGTNIFDIFKNVYTGLEKNKLQTLSKEQSKENKKRDHKSRRHLMRSSSQHKDNNKGTDDEDVDVSFDNDDNQKQDENDLRQSIDASSITEFGCDSSFESEDSNQKSNSRAIHQGGNRALKPQSMVYKAGHGKKIISGRSVAIRVIESCDEVIKRVLADHNPFPIYNREVLSPPVPCTSATSTSVTSTSTAKRRRRRRSGPRVQGKLSLKRLSSSLAETPDVSAEESSVSEQILKEECDRLDDIEELDRAVKALQQAEMSWDHLDWIDIRPSAAGGTSSRQASPAKRRSSPLKGQSVSLTRDSSREASYSSPVKLGGSPWTSSHESPAKTHSFPVTVTNCASPTRDDSSPRKNRPSMVTGGRSPRKSLSSPLKGFDSPAKSHTSLKPNFSPLKHQYSQKEYLQQQKLDQNKKCSKAGLSAENSKRSSIGHNRMDAVSEENQTDKQPEGQKSPLDVDRTDTQKFKALTFPEKAITNSSHISEKQKKKNKSDSERQRKRKRSDSPSPRENEQTRETLDDSPSRKKKKKDKSHKRSKRKKTERVSREDQSVSTRPSGSSENTRFSTGASDKWVGTAVLHGHECLRSPVRQQVIPIVLRPPELVRKDASYLFSLKETDFERKASKDALLNGLELLSTVAVDGGLASGLSSHFDDRTKRTLVEGDRNALLASTSGRNFETYDSKKSCPASEGAKVAEKGSKESLEMASAAEEAKASAAELSCVPSADSLTSQTVKTQNLPTSIPPPSTPIPASTRGPPTTESTTSLALTFGTPAGSEVNKTSPGSKKSITPSAMNRLLKKLYKGKNS